MKLLYVNACVRKDSRTERLAKKLLLRLNEPVEEVRLKDMAFPVVDEAYLNERDRLINEKAFDNPMFELARRFSEAETIVIAAPYWDMSFPAALKQYIELVNVIGITFKYSESGAPTGLCKAKRLFYVVTAGGDYAPDEYGYGYIKAVAQGYYGIADTTLIKAAGLDIDGVDVNAVLSEAEKSIRETVL